jgi:hypothetical protein
MAPVIIVIIIGLLLAPASCQGEDDVLTLTNVRGWSVLQLAPEKVACRS